jgi:3-oxoacyl-[acyl-carrier protein] reductase
MPLTIDLAGRVALVTGGSRGIGAATARLFARCGARVAITYRARQADAERLAAEVDGVALQGDLRRRADNERVVRETVAALGRLDAFVANAGVWPVEAVGVKALADERWRETVEANLDAVFYGCRAALQVMQPGSAIVIVSSTAGQRGEAFHADYAATKGAVISFVKSLAVEVAPGITVNGVAPGWVDTEMAAPALQGAERRRVEAGIPLGRIASADDIAGPIVFLCTSLARHVTGEILNVNGGSVLCG